MMKVKKVILFTFSFMMNCHLIAQNSNYTITTGLYPSNAIYFQLFNSVTNKEINYNKYIKSNYFFIIEKQIHKKNLNQFSIVYGLGVNREKYIYFNSTKYILNNTYIVTAIEKEMRYQNKNKKTAIRCYGIIGIGFSANYQNKNFAEFYGINRFRLNYEFQFSPLNLQFKLYKKLYLECGVGYGYKGVFHLGIDIRK